MPRSWIFQANSEIYRIREALASLTALRWSVKQHRNDIKSGDTVYIWETGPSGGLLAVGRTTSEPFEGTDPPGELPFYVTPPENAPSQRIDLVIDKVFKDPLRRPELLAEPQLDDMQIIRNPRGTNFAVTESEDRILRQLLVPKPTFREVMQRYYDEKVVFSSPEKGSLYSITAVDEGGCEVARLTANEPDRVTFSLHDNRVQQLSEIGEPRHKSLLDKTVAIIATLLHSPEIALAADRVNVLAIPDEASALASFCDWVGRLNVNRNQGGPKLYKPAMLAALIEAIDSGEVPDHRIPFEALIPRFRHIISRVSTPVTADQAAMAFYHLTGDFYWNLAYHDINKRIESDFATISRIRELVSHAVLKEPFRWLLRKQGNRQRVLQAIAEAWWPERARKSSNNVWWVNQGGSYEKERERGTIWCPQVDKAGKPQHHWTNVSRVRRGDVVFHYADQQIRAVSCAKADAAEASKPKEIAIRDEWQQPGWFSEVDYYDLPQPIPSTELRDVFRRVNYPGGPFNKDGGVNMGYLYPLRDRVVCLLAERTAGSDLPAKIAGPLNEIRDRQWDQFIAWGKKFLETSSVRQDERAWKQEYAKLIQEAQSAFLSGTPDWFGTLKRAFTKAGATDYRAHDPLLKRWEANPHQARAALDVLWGTTAAGRVLESLARFSELLPDTALSGVGTRTSVASLLVSVHGVEQYPLYRSNPMLDAYELTGCWSRSENLTQAYDDALRFFDRVIREAASRGFELSDRLDAQSLVWSVVQGEIPAEWSVEEREALLAYREGIETERVTIVKPAPQADSFETLANELLIDPAFIRDTSRLLDSKGQVIFYGPPGTGKTFIAKALAKHFAGDEGSVEIVQFHPSYTYEDFVEGFRPRRTGDKVGFELVRGPLRRLARRAKQNPDAKHVLIIDELNRGNVAKVFGELYFLLEYRNEEIRLQYDHRRTFSLPDNLWIIGTMNTADRSIALIDAALRRRFYFLPFFPDEPPIDGLLNRWLERHRPEMAWVGEIVKRANAELGNRHGAIGPSHFMHPELDDAWMALIWKHSVLPYLAEQFFGEEEQLARFELDALRNRNPQSLADGADLR